VYGSKETYYQVVETSIWLISYSEGLCNKNRIFVSEMLIKCYTLGWTIQEAIMGARPSTKRSVMICKVHSRQAEFLLTY